MLFIRFHIDLLLLAGLLLVAFFVGFVIKNKQVRDARKKIVELEREMLDNHAQILELEKEKAGLINELKDKNRSYSS